MAEEMSKSAKRRAAKKARDAAAAEEEPAPAPAPPAPKSKAAASAPAGYPAAKAKAEAKSAAPEPVPKAKAKSKAAAPEPAPPPPAEPKSKAKAKAKAAEPAPVPEPAPKPAAKSKAKAKAKAEPEPPKQEKTEIIQPFEMDDGTGDWELSTGMTKKQQKQKEKKEEEKRQELIAKQMGSAGNKKIAGFNAEAGGAPINTIPGMAPAGAKAKAQSQSVNASFAGVQAQIAADKLAMEKAAQAAAEGKEPKEQLASATVHVDEKKIGIIIGPGGKRIKELTAKSGVNNIDTSGEDFTITGPPKAVEICKKAIEDLNSKGYCSLLYEDFADDTIMVPTPMLAEIIGKKGVYIIALKDALGVEVNISDTGGKKSKVTIAGEKAKAQKARECIEEILKYYHSEVTHPGQTHEEMEVEAHQYAYIIGKAGSEMRHIQKNYEVRVYIPRKGESFNENVVIVGEPRNVTRAKAHIEKIIWNAENTTKGRGSADKADDHWGDEGEDEPWMKQYLYKRTYK